MAMPQPKTIGRFPHRVLGVAILSFAVALSTLLPFAGGHQPLARSLHAQERTPVIHAVDPALPYCVLRNSEIEAQRILTITGENLESTGGKRLQFQFIAVLEDSVISNKKCTGLPAKRRTGKAQPGSRWT